MRKLFLAAVIGAALLASIDPAFALLRKDLGYVLGTVQAKDPEVRTIVIKDEAGQIIKFTADGEQFDSVQVGNNVMVSHQLNSNQIFGIFVRS